MSDKEWTFIMLAQIVLFIAWVIYMAADAVF